MSTGPGPKEPPFLQRVEDVGQKALNAVEQALAPVVTRAETVASTVATEAKAVEQDVGASLVEAMQKMHATEIAAIAHVQALGGKVAVVMKRFVGNPSVDAARAKLEGAVTDFETALRAATV